MRAANPNTLTVLRPVLAGLFPFLPPSVWLAVWRANGVIPQDSRMR